MTSLVDRVVDAIPTGVAYLDRDLVFGLCNATQARYFGRTVDQVVDHRLHDVITGNQDFRQELERVIQTGISQPQSGIAVTWADRPEEGEHHYLVAYIAEKDERGEVRGVFMTAQEITDAIVTHRALQANEARLQQLTDDLEKTVREQEETVREKDVLVGALSHELRTPLTAIHGNADILARRLAELDEESRSRAVADIREEAEHLNLLVENMLLLARASLQSTIETEPISLGHFLRDLTKKRLEPHGHRNVTVSVSPRHLMAMVQLSYFEQVLNNLLDNATKYSPVETAIDVSARRLGSDVVVSVCDRGAGITQKESDIIFQPFYRSQRTATGVRGAGIGLAVCKLLVQAQSGRVWARRRRGGGSVFSFTVPACADTTEA